MMLKVGSQERSDKDVLGLKDTEDRRGKSVTPWIGSNTGVNVDQIT